MAQDRISAFTTMLQSQPENAMIWYGLGSEYLKIENWEEAANSFANVIARNPDYTAAYQMLGTALSRSGKPEEAKDVWEQGIAVAERTGAWSARQHMTRLLEGTSKDPQFCSGE